VKVELVARKEKFDLPGVGKVDGYTLNHTSPGPEIRVRQGQLIQVTLVNESVEDGVTLHWHGVDVPNAEDGVAGVTQNAVRIGQRFEYRFVAEDPGTYWYHSHQISHEQVKGGLLGPLVVLPKTAPAQQETDTLALLHSYDKRRTVSGKTGEQKVVAPAGSAVRVRVINTDNGPVRIWVSGTPYRIGSIDGRDVHEPGEVRDTALLLTAGGRVDLLLKVPPTGAARVGLGGGGISLVVGPDGAQAPPDAAPGPNVDLLSYGKPAPLPFDPEKADRHFKYDIGRRPAFVGGKPGLFWTINGHLFPDMPMYMVNEGDLVRMTIKNHSGQVHPMHLHGHHVVVLSRNGVAATGSPWWTDSLNVANNESYDVAFLADNPGVWMDHCHNLPHAAQGLVAHLMYMGVNSPYRIGKDDDNEPE
jgi:FtsP/CotA-like multicopper oxidase with cupredoxin domain